MEKLNLWLAPLFSLYSRNFYRKVVAARLGKGFLYLIYLSLILSAVFIGLMKMNMIPMVDSFVQWMAKEMPVLQVTMEGIHMKEPSPKVLTHPDFGPVVVFDMNGELAGLEGKMNAPVLVTAKKIFVKSRQGIRTYDVRQMMEQQQRGKNENIVLTGDSILQAYDQFSPWIFVIVFFAVFLFCFIMQMIQGLVSSLIGVLINLFRNPKLPYSAVLNASFFALTASCILSVLQISVPFLGFIPRGFWFSVILTGIYLMLAVKLTETPEEAA